jgi:hypothetical protein
VQNAAPVVAVVVVIASAGVGLISLRTGGGVIPSASATSAIPSRVLTLYEQAAVTCPGLPWTVPAAVSKENAATTTKGGAR